MRIAITGGTGFVGGHLAMALAAAGHDVVVLARGVDQRPWARKIRGLPGVTVADGGIADGGALARAFAGCDGVAHCAGINQEAGGQTYDAVHVRGTRNVVERAAEAGVGRLALVSFLGARPESGSRYHESKWAAEETVRSSDLDWTVLKPGMMFGLGDHMLAHLSLALCTFPIYIGFGARRVRPLAVADAVKVLSAAVLEARLARQTVPLVGPTELTFDDAARMVARVLGKRRVFVRLPTWFHRAVAVVAERTMTTPLVARAQVRMLEEGIVDAAGPCDPVPADLVPTTPFDEHTIRDGLPAPRRLGRDDFRLLARRR